MSKNVRIRNLEKAVFELADLLGYWINLSKGETIPKPIEWKPTFVEQLSVLRKALNIGAITIAPPPARIPRVEVKYNTEKK